MELEYEMGIVLLITGLSVGIPLGLYLKNINLQYYSTKNEIIKIEKEKGIEYAKNYCDSILKDEYIKNKCIILNPRGNATRKYLKLIEELK